MNGTLDDHDPEYLFVSDLTGNNFKQISPDNRKVLSWTIVKKSGKILMQTVKDTNHDGIMDYADNIIPYTYDIKSGALPEEVFSADFKESVSNLYHLNRPDKK